MEDRLSQEVIRAARQAVDSSPTPMQQAKVEMRINGVSGPAISGSSSPEQRMRIDVPEGDAESELPSAAIKISSGHTTVVVPGSAVRSFVSIEPEKIGPKDGTHNFILGSGSLARGTKIEQKDNGAQIEFANGNTLFIDEKQKGEVSLAIIPDGLALGRTTGPQTLSGGTKLVLWKDGALQANPETLQSMIAEATRISQGLPTGGIGDRQ